MCVLNSLLCFIGLLVCPWAVSTLSEVILPHNELWCLSLQVIQLVYLEEYMNFFDCLPCCKF